jgi:tetratricopeptide (TPR) repeat protein
VISEQEIQLISFIKRGKDYALGSRTDLAEYYFSKALLINPNLASLQNDLGYVLLRQNRISEAKSHINQALTIDQYNLVARENLARLYYFDGDFKASLEQYEKLLDLYYGYWQEKPDPLLEFSNADLVGVYRDLISLYALLGKMDESICHARLALGFGTPTFTPSHYARLLLTMGEVRQTKDYLSSIIQSQEGPVDSKLLLDYGISLYLLNDNNLAREAFLKVLSTEDSNKTDRNLARLFLYTLDDTDLNASDLLSDLKNDQSFCDNIGIETNSYLPQPLLDKLSLAVDKICER